MTAAAALVMFYSAAGNAVLALIVGTCNQGDASRLWGGAISLLLYAIGTVCMRRTSKSLLVLVAIAPILPVLIWQAVFALKLATGFWHYGKSACDVLDGTTGQFVDGDEASFATISLAVAATSWAGVASLASNLMNAKRHLVSKR